MANIQRSLIVLGFVTKSSCAVGPASPIRKRTPLGQFAADADIEVADGLVDTKPKLSPSAESESSPIRKRIASGQVEADGGIDITDGLGNSTRKVSPSATGIARPFRKRIASGQVAPDGAIDITDGLVDSTRKLSPSVVRKEKRREYMEVHANGNFEMSQVDKGQIAGNVGIETSDDLGLQQQEPKHDMQRQIKHSPQDELLLRPSTAFAQGSPLEVLQRPYGVIFGASQSLNKIMNASYRKIPSVVQKLKNRTTYGTQVFSAIAKSPNASLVVPNEGVNTAIVMRRGFHSQHNMPMSSSPSVMQTSYRKQIAWASGALLHSALLLVFFLVALVLLCFWSVLFDFEMVDNQSGGSRLYKWVWEASDHDVGVDVGVEAVAGSHVFHDYHHIDIELTSANVTELLTTHGCMPSVKPYIPEILWDCIRQSSRFMTTKDQSNMLLIRDSVLVRFSYRSHLLVERVEGRRDEMAHYTIPTLDKIGAESPERAAEQWCARTLDFDCIRKHVRFIESGEVTHCIDKYEGLRTVERKFVVVVQLIHDNPQMPAFPADQPLFWMPLSEIEACPQIPKHIAFAEVNLWVGGKLHPEVDLHELENFLKSNGVDTTGWSGVDGTNTPESLLSEINLGQCILKLEGATVKRVINLAALRLRLCGEDETLLVEVGRREPSGVIKWRMQLPGTKQKVTETMEAAAHRICKEQLGLGEEDFDIYPETSRECIKNASPSKTYPGIMTAYYTYLVTVDLRDDVLLAHRFRRDASGWIASGTVDLRDNVPLAHRSRRGSSGWVIKNSKTSLLPVSSSSSSSQEDSEDQQDAYPTKAPPILPKSKRSSTIRPSDSPFWSLRISAIIFRSFRKLHRVSPRKIGTLWGQ